MQGFFLVWVKVHPSRWLCLLYLRRPWLCCMRSALARAFRCMQQAGVEHLLYRLPCGAATTVDHSLGAAMCQVVSRAGGLHMPTLRLSRRIVASQAGASRLCCVASLLLTAPALVRIPSRDGCRALHYAIRVHSKLSRWLIRSAIIDQISGFLGFGAEGTRQMCQSTAKRLDPHRLVAAAHGIRQPAAHALRQSKPHAASAAIHAKTART